MSALAHEILLLENGDRLTRKEFEQRYRAMPRLRKAELIEGVVFMPSPLHFEQHAKPHALVMGWLAAYWAATPGIELADNATLRLDADNEFQPDALLRLPERAGGASRVSRDDYLEGAPELIVEVASTSASHDLHDKRKVYRRNGVREYLVWLVRERRLLWFVVEDDEYQPLQPGADGLLRSRVFAGLALNSRALLDGDLARVLADQQRCQGGEEHQRFVEALRQTTSE
ncbi:MAG: Uma2 family endonuclease [Candidatus Contendobacter sp.]|nr:Uma2 family endonuclease [Candidatus Contendobacter sp.]MDG4556256.1 Uma2 family endonuclease [Candidatus Contendobacter sp.]